MSTPGPWDIGWPSSISPVPTTPEGKKTFTEFLKWWDESGEAIGKTVKGGGKWWLGVSLLTLVTGGFANLTFGKTNQMVQELQRITEDYGEGVGDYWTKVTSSCEGGGWFCTDGDALEWINKLAKQLAEEKELVIGYKNAAQAEGSVFDENEKNRAAVYAKQASLFATEFGQGGPAMEKLEEWWTSTDDILEIIVACAQGIRDSKMRMKQWALDAQDNDLQIAGVDTEKLAGERKSDPVKTIALATIAVGAIYMLGRSSKKTTTTIPM